MCSNSVLGGKKNSMLKLPYRITFWQLRSLVAEEMRLNDGKPTFSFSYVRADLGGPREGEGETNHLEVRDGEIIRCDEPALVEAPHFILRKTVWFRSFPYKDDGHGVCCVP
eukprot:TRINITY_DN98708_c0_g1_i1.p1 TRINITY_DN98708_c0_g1~~TRINITY_DN98708_c0_g1_i1.p1  ORF type:complete len:127 (+),score=16.81 TRINITY_DN98708_c0_g1_i1:50-382(+)